MLINLAVGDYHADGHGICYDHFIESNLTLDEIQDAYATFFETYSRMEPFMEFCEEEEEDYAPKEFIDFLKQLGLTNGFDDTDDGDNYYVDPDQYFRIVTFIVKHIRADWEYKEVDIAVLPIGGYGCVPA